MHGRIIRFRIAASLIAPLAVLSAGVPASAQASSLLSGYGGPGSGSQMILGSTLLKGSRGGGGGGGSAVALAAGGGGGGGSAVASGSSTKSQASTVRVTAVSTRSTPQGPVPGAGGQGNSAGRTVKTALDRAPAGLAARGTPPAAPRDSRTLGLTSADLLYVLLACGALAGVGLLTWRLARIRPREAGT
jgi:hypothetical protein